MGIKLNSSGGGSVTIQEPTTASNFTLTLPASTGNIAVADGSGNLAVSGNLQFNSGYGSAATAYGCRAWVNFNGTGTVAIRGSGNVSSITDNGVGNYTVNFTNAMPDTNYASPSSVSYDLSSGSGVTVLKVISQTTGAVSFFSSSPAGSAVDSQYLAISCFR